jgi:Fur family transcriptional regulator, ferric uptake regulator
MAPVNTRNSNKANLLCTCIDILSIVDHKVKVLIATMFQKIGFFLKILYFCAQIIPAMTASAQLLKAQQLRITDMRIKVLDLFLSHQEALSQNDLENSLSEADRITLYRTLRTFEESGLIHRAIDGTDKQKYALCKHTQCKPNQHFDHHAHFHCDDCGKTTCVEDIAAPTLSPPPGFSISKTHLVIHGTCRNCRVGG